MQPFFKTKNKTAGSIIRQLFPLSTLHFFSFAIVSPTPRLHHSREPQLTFDPRFSLQCAAEGCSRRRESSAAKNPLSADGLGKFLSDNGDSRLTSTSAVRPYSTRTGPLPPLTASKSKYIRYIQVTFEAICPYLHLRVVLMQHKSNKLPARPPLHSKAARKNKHF